MPTITHTTEPSQYQTACHIADRLGETEPAPRHAIYSIVQTLDRTQSLKILSWAIQCHDTHGGIKLSNGHNGQKMRVGSIFLHYAHLYGKPLAWRFVEYDRLRERRKG